MIGLQALLLQITMEAAEDAPILLDEYPGSSLRGALFEALLRRFCMNPTAPTCAACQLNATCPVATLVAPLRDEGPRGRDIPRPFVLASAPTPTTVAAGAAHPIDSDMSAAAIIPPGGQYTFALTLVGRACQFFPYIAMSLPTLEVTGLGRRQNGRRGRPRVVSVQACDPFTGATQALYQRGNAQVAEPTLVMTPERVAARAATLPADRMTLHFRSPTRLIAQGQLMRRPDLRTLVARLSERLDALTQEYGEPGVRAADVSAVTVALAATDTTGGVDAADTTEATGATEATARDRRRDDDEVWRRRWVLLEWAERARLTRDETRWVDVASYSSRQRRATPIGGFVGRATYEGDLAALRELLVWGEIVHVGKNAVKGDGLYRIERDGEDAG